MIDFCDSNSLLKVNTCTFSSIANIIPENCDTWCDKLFLTIDIDWAHDDIINDTLSLIEQANVPVTWFITHDTPLLDRLKSNPRHELGIHPNFNPLLDGINRDNANYVVDSLLDLVPEAKSVRSHSMTQSSRLLDLFKSRGLTHDVNHFIPSHANIELKPWSLWNNLCKVPYFWEDDLHLLYEPMGFKQDRPVELALRRNKLKVFDFHPIHVFLNSESLDRYEQTRSLHQNPCELIKYRYSGYGTRSRLLELLKLSFV